MQSAKSPSLLINSLDNLVKSESNRLCHSEQSEESHQIKKLEILHGACPERDSSVATLLQNDSRRRIQDNQTGLFTGPSVFHFALLTLQFAFYNGFFSAFSQQSIGLKHQNQNHGDESHCIPRKRDGQNSDEKCFRESYDDRSKHCSRNVSQASKNNDG